MNGFVIPNQPIGIRQIPALLRPVSRFSPALATANRRRCEQRAIEASD
jgi:hypothetical protein